MAKWPAPSFSDCVFRTVFRWCLVRLFTCMLDGVFRSRELAPCELVPGSAFCFLLKRAPRRRRGTAGDVDRILEASDAVVEALEIPSR